jgi:dsRNA-specific ribonuclease
LQIVARASAASRRAAEQEAAETVLAQLLDRPERD